MSDTPGNNLQRLHDLLAEQATAGLTRADQVELQKLLIENANHQREGYELAAAAVDMALAPPETEPLPAAVRKAALLKNSMETDPEPEPEPVVYEVAEEPPAPRRINAPAQTPAPMPTAPVQLPPVAPVHDPESEPELESEMTAPVGPPESSRGTGWLIAASMISVAVLMYVAGRTGLTGGPPNQSPDQGAVQPLDPPSNGKPQPKVIADKPTSGCDKIKSDDPDALVLAFNPIDSTFGDVVGEVRFSTKLQQGCMTLRGLPRLPPQQAVYQLWVFDADRQGPPVDAGTFEVTGDVRVDERVEFQAKQSITRPVVFAITREAPGGAVTSVNPPILVAKLGV